MYKKSNFDGVSEWTNLSPKWPLELRIVLKIVQYWFVWNKDSRSFHWNNDLLISRYVRNVLRMHDLWMKNSLWKRRVRVENYLYLGTISHQISFLTHIKRSLSAIFFFTFFPPKGYFIYISLHCSYQHQYRRYNTNSNKTLHQPTQTQTALHNAHAHSCWGTRPAEQNYPSVRSAPLTAASQVAPNIRAHKGLTQR